MFNLTSQSLNIRLVVAATDLRKSFTGLSALIRELHAGELDPRYLYLFSNRTRNRLKLLYYDRSGVSVTTKRLEQGTFSWPPREHASQVVMPITSEALQLILDGVELRGVKLRPWYRAE